MKKSQKKKATPKQKVIFIDWNGTLSPSNFWVHLEKSEKQEDKDLFKLWADAMFINHKDMIVPWMRGEYSTEDMLTLVSKETKTDFQKVLKEFIKGCEKMEYSSPKIPELVKKLKQKSALMVIATNNMDSFTRWTIPAMKLDLLFDDVLNSFYLKAMKHDLDNDGNALFFKDFFKEYNIDPSVTECFFIDDGEDKMGVISNLGIDYRRVNAENTLEHELQKILAIN